MAVWISQRISDVINEIEEEKFVLPVIQRRLVWDEDKMIQLFDTLLKGNSFGGIMVIEEEKGDDPLFHHRPFTKTGDPIASRDIGKLTQQQYFVIDGQQRLQAFYIGLKGNFGGKVLYFDLYSEYFVDYQFKFENDISKLKAVSNENNERPVPEHNWYLVSSLLKRLKETDDEDQVAAEIIQKQGITDDVRKTHITKNVKTFYKNIISSTTLGISKVSVNKSLDDESNKQRIVELFRRVNDGGTKLSPFDLVASVLKGFDWQMESFLENTLTNYTDLGLSQDNLIKLIFLLRDNHAREITGITADDAKFAIQYRERIICTLEALRAFLIEADLYNFYKDGNRSFIPFFFILYHLFHKPISNDAVQNFFKNHDANNSDYPLLKKWLYYSLINGVFRSKGAGWVPYSTGIKKMLPVMQTAKGQTFPLDNLFEVYYEYGVTFTEVIDSSKLAGFERQFLYYLMYDRKSTIRPQDIDHIMAKSLLEGKFEWDKINNIANFQLIDTTTNRGEKNAKPFKEWMEQSVKDKPAFVKRHLIPSDESIWDIENFDSFVSEREKLILDKITQYVTESNGVVIQSVEPQSQN